MIWLYVLIGVTVLTGLVIYHFKKIKALAGDCTKKVNVLDDTIRVLKETHEREVIREAVILFEREMQQMGADIHDDLVQKLAGFRLFIDRIERANSESEVQAILIKMNGEFKQVVESVRRVSHRLFPDGIETGSLNNALQQLCNQLGPYQVTHIHFLPRGPERVLADESLQNIYRIVQELINNVIKHTSAWHIWVRVHWNDDDLEIEIEDDGFHYERLERQFNNVGRGLLTLQKRASLIGASVTYEEAPKGTKAVVKMPFAYEKVR